MARLPLSRSRWPICSPLHTHIGSRTRPILAKAPEGGVPWCSLHSPPQQDTLLSTVLCFLLSAAGQGQSRTSTAASKTPVVAGARGRCQALVILLHYGSDSIPTSRCTSGHRHLNIILLHSVQDPGKISTKCMGSPSSPLSPHCFSVTRS